MSEETFGERVRRLRNNKGMSHDYLALRADITPEYLKSIESNIAVSPDVIDRLASALGTTPEYLKNGGAPFKEHNLRNLERYITDKGIDDKEAKALKRRIESMSTRASKPLGTLDFDALREYRHSGRIGSEPCYRCGRNYGGSRCPYCGSFWGDPD
jgi:transcriptional regulator with XRE-family HTH domain